MHVGHADAVLSAGGGPGRNTGVDLNASVQYHTGPSYTKQMRGRLTLCQVQVSARAGLPGLDLRAEVLCLTIPYSRGIPYNFTVRRW